MPRYDSADVTFDVPNDWDDKTVVAFSAPPKPNTIVPNAVLTRDVLKPGEAFESYVDRMLVDMAKGLSSFVLIAKEKKVVGDGDGFELQYTWRGASGKTVHQRMLITQTAGRNIVGLNLTCGDSEAKKFAATSDRVMASFSVRRAGT